MWSFFINSFMFSHLAYANSFDFGYLPDLSDGEKPTLLLTPDADIKRIRVRVEVGGKTYQFEKTGTDAGEELQFSWPRDASITTANAYIDAVFQDGYTAQAEVPIEYSYGESLTVDLSKAVADLKKQVLTVRVNDAVETAEIVTYGAYKKRLDSKTISMNAGPGKINVPWTGNLKDVVLLDVTFQSGNAYAGFTYSPWFLDIPHEDVLFESNSAAIDKGEEWKLESTMEELKDVLEKYGEVVPVKLYIGGCTDTVGSQSHNKELSLSRARSIAKWIRSQGYESPIFYYGFGENWLAVPTGDGVDEVENRRAVYIVAANPPPPGTGVPQVRWKELR